MPLVLAARVVAVLELAARQAADAWAAQVAAQGRGAVAASGVAVPAYYLLACRGGRGAAQNRLSMPGGSWAALPAAPPDALMALRVVLPAAPAGIVVPPAAAAATFQVVGCYLLP